MQPSVVSSSSAFGPLPPAAESELNSTQRSLKSKTEDVEILLNPSSKLKGAKKEKSKPESISSQLKESSWREIRESLLPCDDRLSFVPSFQNIQDVDAALERGIDINACDEHGYSPVHYAARRGNLKVLKYLVSKNGDINKVAENEIGETPLLLSIDSGDLSVTHYLSTRGADPSICNKYGFNALHCAVNGRRTLHLAYLLKLPGMNINAQDYTGRTPLHWAAFNSNTSCVRELLKQNPDIFRTDQTGLTALHLATIAGKLAAATYLLDKNVNLIAVKCKAGKTAIQYAREYRHEALLDYLLQMYRIHRLPVWVQKYRYLLASAIWVCVTFAVFTYLPTIFGAVLVGLLLAITRNLYQSRDFYAQKNPTFAGAFQTSNLLAFSTFLFKLMWYNLDEWYFIIIALAMYFYGLKMVWQGWRIDPGYIEGKPSDLLTMYDHLKQEHSDTEDFCPTCLLKRPLRAKHCSACGRCVLRCDHHCPWINNCVGVNNLYHFYMLVVLFIFGDPFFLHFAWRYVSRQPEVSAALSQSLWAGILAAYRTQPFLFFTATWHSFNIAWVIPLLVNQTYQIAKNLTTFERQNWKRYSYMKDEHGSFRNPFDKGLVANFREALYPPKSGDNYAPVDKQI